MPAPHRQNIALILRLAAGATWLAAPLAPLILRKRLRKGKEDPSRWREKRGYASAPRPDGRLIWLHAVGIGEALAMPVLIAALRKADPELRFLTTCTVRGAAEALRPNLPDDVPLQFLPLDSGPARRRFLRHWLPDMVLWVERDIWPGWIHDCARRGIPQLIVNGRMTAASGRKKTKGGLLFRAIFTQMAQIFAQDTDSRDQFAQFGVAQDRLHVHASLKSAGAPLWHDPALLKSWVAALTGRTVWIAASTHAADEAVLAEAQKTRDPKSLLVLLPRDPARDKSVFDGLSAMGLRVQRAATQEPEQPAPEAQVLLVPETGALGLWYRVARPVFIGGSFSDIEGHNPLEAARLDCSVAHGPHIANFAADYERLHNADAAQCCKTAAELNDFLESSDHAGRALAALSVSQSGREEIEALARKICGFLPE